MKYLTYVGDIYKVEMCGALKENEFAVYLFMIYLPILSVP
jgi:hypothetical protein